MTKELTIEERARAEVELLCALPEFDAAYRLFAMEFDETAPRGCLLERYAHFHSGLCNGFTIAEHLVGRGEIEDTCRVMRVGGLNDSGRVEDAKAMLAGFIVERIERTGE